jgi:hypothetical protein
MTQGRIARSEPLMIADTLRLVIGGGLRARGLGDEDGVVLVMEHPQIPIGLADAQAGLVRLQHGSASSASV